MMQLIASIMAMVFLFVIIFFKFNLFFKAVFFAINHCCFNPGTCKRFLDKKGCFMALSLSSDRAQGNSDFHKSKLRK